MKILVRLPNWLGDMVMSVGFIRQLSHFFPGAEISVIAKKGIHELLPFFPELKHKFIFDKQEFKSIAGLVQYGQRVRKTEKFDLFFCLPDSFSAAIMGAATGAKKRIGYKKELRQVLLTDSYRKPGNLHRAEEYTSLIEFFVNQKPEPVDVFFESQVRKKELYNCEHQFGSFIQKVNCGESSGNSRVATKLN